MAVMIDGKACKTICDAARHFRVSAKTMNTWIRKGVVPEPPEEHMGLRRFHIFPDAWFKEAEAALAGRKPPRR